MALSGCSLLFNILNQSHKKEMDKYMCEGYAKQCCRLYPHTRKLIEATALDLVSCNRCVEMEYRRCIEMSPHEYYIQEEGKCLNTQKR